MTAQATEPEVKAVAPEPEVEPVAHTLSAFEGIEPEAMQATDWTTSCPLTCDVCDLPATVELEVPATFNAIASSGSSTIARSSIDIILHHSTAHGDMSPEVRESKAFYDNVSSTELKNGRR